MAPGLKHAVGEGFQQRRRQEVAVAASMDGLAAVLEALPHGMPTTAISMRSVLFRSGLMSQSIGTCFEADATLTLFKLALRGKCV